MPHDKLFRKLLERYNDSLIACAAHGQRLFLQLHRIELLQRKQIGEAHGVVPTRVISDRQHPPSDRHTHAVGLDRPIAVSFVALRVSSTTPRPHRNQTTASLRPLNHTAIASTGEHTSHVPRITARVGGSLVAHERRVPSRSLLDQVDIRVERDSNAEISQAIHYIASVPRLYVPAGCSPAICRLRSGAWLRRRPCSRPSTTRARERAQPTLIVQSAEAVYTCWQSLSQPTP